MQVAIAANGGFATAVWNAVVVQVHRAVADAGAIDALSRARTEVLNRRHSKWSLLLVIESSAPPPPAEPRRALLNFLKEERPRVEHWLAVAEGGGFRAATVRSVGVAVSFLAPRAFPFTIVESVGAAVAALVEPADRASLTTAVELVRSRLHGARSATGD